MTSLPSATSLRLLSIDGGGMKGYTSLMILKRIMRTIQNEGDLPEEPKPCDVFDLIGGTSTGGLIAVMLGRLRMTVDDCIKKYEELGKEIFASKPKGGKFGKFLTGMASSTFYSTGVLQQEIQKVIDDCGYRTDEAFQEISTSLCRTLLCVTRVSTSKPEVLRNYKATDPTQENYDCTIWEAASATAAAPMFFKSVTLSSTHDNFCDGGMKRTNPIDEIIQEYERIREWNSKEIGCIVSIGTGVPNFRKVEKRLDKLLEACVNIMMDAQDIADRFAGSNSGRMFADSNRYFRFNVPQGMGDIQLDGWEDTNKMRDRTLEYLRAVGTGRDIEQCAKSLINPDANCQPQDLLDNYCVESRIRIPEAKFFGRERELDEIRRCLDPKVAVRKGVVIYALSGFGKTQLAIHYIHKFRTLYSSVLWIDASTKDRLEGSFEEIASQLHSQDLTQTTSAIDCVNCWLSRHTNKSWLMVIDSVDEVDQGPIRQYLPSCDHGSFIITTTRSDLSSLPKFCPIELEGVDDIAGSKILLHALGNVSPNEIIKSTAIGIVQKLKGIPLATEQAGAFLSIGTVTIYEYKQLFETRYRDLMMFEPGGDHWSYEKNNPIFVAQDLLYKALRKKNSDSVKILNLLAFLGPGEISFTLLAETPLPDEYSWGISAAGHASSSSDTEYALEILGWLIRLRDDKIRFSTAVRDLKQTCLTKFSYAEGRISSSVVHDMVRIWILWKLPKREVEAYAVTAFGLTGTLLHGQSGLKLPGDFQRYTARINTILGLISSHVSQSSLSFPEGKYAKLYGSTAFGFGKFCRAQGQFRKAQELLSAAIEYSMATEGAAWPSSTQSLTELEDAALVEWELGNLDNAIEKLESLSTSSNLGDSNGMDVRVAASLRELRERKLAISQAEARAYDASKTTKRSLAIPDGLPLSCCDLDDEELWLVGNYDDAKSLLGEDDIETVRQARKLADYYRKFNRTSNEEPLREYIWRYYYTISEPTHPLSIRSMHELCKCYKKTGRLASELRGKLRLAPRWARKGKYKNIEGLLLAAEESEIYLAALEGQSDVVSQLLEQQIDVNKRDSYGNTALHWAVEGKSWSTIQLLLGKADIDAKDRDGATPLYKAAGLGHEGVIWLLLEGGANINATNLLGNTPLHISVRRGHLAATLLLLERGANINVKGYHEEAVLCNAVLNGHEAMVRLLVEKGADINGQGHIYGSALSAALLLRRTKIFELLVEKGAHVHATNVPREIALYRAYWRSDEPLVELLLSKRANAKAKANKEKVALLRAVESGQEVFVRQLLREGANINAMYALEGTALHMSALRGYDAMTQLLLEEGANVDAEDIGGATALFDAARNGHQVVVQLLLEKGANADARDKGETTALFDAALFGHEAVVRLLLEYGANVNAISKGGSTALHRATRSRSEAVVRLLLEEGADIDAHPHRGLTPLFIATQEGHEAITRVLLGRGANVNVKTNYGETALYKAAHNGKEAVVKLLLENEADMNFQDGFFGNPLQAASCYGHEKIVQLLLEKGADVNAQGGSYGNALQAASASGQEQIVRLLIERGADVSAQGGTYNSALNAALCKRHTRIAQLLCENKGPVL